MEGAVGLGEATWFLVTLSGCLLDLWTVQWVTHETNLGDPSVVHVAEFPVEGLKGTRGLGTWDPYGGSMSTSIMLKRVRLQWACIILRAKGLTALTIPRDARRA